MIVYGFGLIYRKDDCLESATITMMGFIFLESFLILLLETKLIPGNTCFLTYPILSQLQGLYLYCLSFCKKNFCASAIVSV